MCLLSLDNFGVATDDFGQAQSCCSITAFVCVDIFRTCLGCVCHHVTQIRSLHNLGDVVCDFGQACYMQ